MRRLGSSKALLATAVLTLGLSVGAQAQLSNFQAATIGGITTSLFGTGVKDGQSYKVWQFGLKAQGSTSLTFGGNTYQITQIFGVIQAYAAPGATSLAGDINNVVDDSAISTVRANPPAWDLLLNGNNDKIGFDHPGASNRINNGTLPYAPTFAWYDPNPPNSGNNPVNGQAIGSVPAGDALVWGWHLTYVNPSTGAVATAFFFGNPGGQLPPSGIPEPAFYQLSALLGLGGLGLFRLRRARK